MINKDEIIMMLINFPDIGFSNSQNINIPDKFYTNIKESVVKSVSKATSDPNLLLNNELNKEM